MINFQYDAAHSSKWTQRSQVYGPAGIARTSKEALREKQAMERREKELERARASEVSRIMTDGVFPRENRRASYVPYVDPKEKRETLYYRDKRPTFRPSCKTNASLRNGYRDGVHCCNPTSFPGRRHTGVHRHTQIGRPQTAPSDTYRTTGSRRSPLIDEKTWYPQEDKEWYEPPAKWGGRTLYSPTNGTYGPGDPTSTGTFGNIEPNPRPRPYRSIAHTGRGGGKPMPTPADDSFRTKSRDNYFEQTGGKGARYFQ
eukprot:gb/GECG01015647.1/.p1 GENE.gb/GECG01015647.1/~~gb/GECG01015647.1/.p1  ORF type:complete len:257 (+),score=10.68 gb/GECG01015647.1/:1-771(+)